VGEENDRIGKRKTPTDQPTSDQNETPTKNRVVYGNLPRITCREASLQPEQSEGHTPKARKKFCYTRDPGMFWVGVATLVAIIVYAGYARELAITSQEGNKIAKDNAIASDRPWIGPSQIGITKVEAGKKPTITWTITNFGKSPGMVTVIQSGYVVAGFEIKEPLIINRIEGFPKMLVGTLYPGQGFSNFKTFPDSLTPSDIDNITARRLTIFGAAKIVYKDRDGGTHTTWVQSPYDPSTGSMGMVRPEGLPADN